LPPDRGVAMKNLLNPQMTDQTLDTMSEEGRFFDAILHNTVNATVVRGGEKTNVIPTQISVQLDGRLLPGFAPEKLFEELRHIIGDDVDLEVIHHDGEQAVPDMGLLRPFPLSCKRLIREGYRFLS